MNEVSRPANPLPCDVIRFDAGYVQCLGAVLGIAQGVGLVECGATNRVGRDVWGGIFNRRGSGDGWCRRGRGASRDCAGSTGIATHNSGVKRLREAERRGEFWVKGKMFKRLTFYRGSYRLFVGKQILRMLSRSRGGVSVLGVAIWLM